MPKSTRQKRRGKAAIEKPFPDFPLSPHASGCWQKKIRGKIFYFGRWARRVNGQLEKLPGDEWWQPALAVYKAQADDLHAGRTPRTNSQDGLTVAELCNRFLTAKTRQLKAGEITAGTFAEYRATTDRLVAQFGKERLVDDLAADDFEVLRDGMAEQWGPVRLANSVQRVRTVFKYGYEAGLIDKAVRYGPQFKKPSASVLRRHRAKNGERLVEADECRRLLDAADVQLRAMILLGINSGFVGKDCADLPLSALDLVGGWVNFPRPKTGIQRRCPLWIETVEALRAAIAERPEPRVDDAEGLVFVTTRGRPWLSRGQANPVSVAARKLMKEVEVHRAGIGFATLRHVFQTIADGARDPVATSLLMGHAEHGMASHYRERIDDSRLLAVTEHVRQWIFSAGKEGGD